MNNSNNIIYFNSFGVEHIPNKIKNFIGNKNILTNIYRMQAYNSIRCEYFFIECIHFMLKSKSLIDYTNFFSPTEYEKNDKIIVKIF